MNRSALRKEFENKFNFIDRKEQPMFMSVKYIHWLETKLQSAVVLNYKYLNYEDFCNKNQIMDLNKNEIFEAARKLK